MKFLSPALELAQAKTRAGVYLEKGTVFWGLMSEDQGQSDLFFGFRQKSSDNAKNFVEKKFG